MSPTMVSEDIPTRA